MTDIYNKMKNLIRKILKEENDEFEWARGLDDLSRVEKETFSSFYDLEKDYGFEGPRYYKMMVDAGIRDIDILKELGEDMYRDVENVYDNGRDSGRDDCTCDGCCDDYYDWDYVQEKQEEAREEGRDEGREESESEIQELKDRIEELESQLNETVNKKNTKRI